MAPRPTPMPDGSALAAAAQSSDAQRLLEAATHRGRVAGMSDPHLVQRAGAALERFLATAADPATRTAGLEADPSSLDALLTIFAASPYLAEIVISDPDAWEAVRTGQGRPERKEALAAALEADVGTTTDPQTIMRVLRRFKRRQTLRIAYGDVVAGQRLETVVQQISHVADCIVAAALRVAERRAEARRGVPRGPDGRRATIAALALGKLGGAELNYSSDVDLVFVHSDDGRVEGPKPGTNQEFFELVVQETVRLLAEPTDLGIAYRIDLRLRPHGAVGPASMACGPLLRYVDREGRTWERQAWLKARCVAGDAALGDRLLAALEPWIHRRWLTGADIAGIKALKRRIEQRAIRAGTDGADVKHGRGGIRDIEFTIQFLQLLNGGDAPRVRTGTTLEAIRRLTEAGALTDQEREILERNYTLLRTVEHRLQIVEDRQTHLLPDLGRTDLPGLEQGGRQGKAGVVGVALGEPQRHRLVPHHLACQMLRVQGVTVDLPVVVHAEPRVLARERGPVSLTSQFEQPVIAQAVFDIGAGPTGEESLDLGMARCAQATAEIEVMDPLRHRIARRQGCLAQPGQSRTVAPAGRLRGLDDWRRCGGHRARRRGLRGSGRQRRRRKRQQRDGGKEPGNRHGFILAGRPDNQRVKVKASDANVRVRAPSSHTMTRETPP